MYLLHNIKIQKFAAVFPLFIELGELIIIKKIYNLWEIY